MLLQLASTSATTIIVSAAITTDINASIIDISMHNYCSINAFIIDIDALTIMIDA